MLLQTYVAGQSDTEASIFSVPIESAKTTTQTIFYMHAPTFKYQQSDYNSYFLISLTSAVFVVNQFNA